MYYAVLTIHLLVCVFLVIVVLLQHGKGADIGATFGGSSQTVFGARGAATILSKITVGAAFVFMVTSLALAHLSSSGTSKSLLAPDKTQNKNPSASPSVPPQQTPQVTPQPTALETPAQKK